MDPLQPVLTRRSVRRYRPDPVPADLLVRILDAGRLAPTGMNLQPWEFVVVTDETTRKAVGRYARYYIIKSYQVAEAPVLVAVCGHHRRSPMYLADCIFAAAMMMVAANALGIGSCWIGGFKAEKVKGILAIPPAIDLVGLVTLGYSDEPPVPPPKRDLADVVHWERYGRAPQEGRIKLAARSGPLSVLRDLVRIQLRLR